MISWNIFQSGQNRVIASYSNMQQIIAEVQEFWKQLCQDQNIREKFEKCAELLAGDNVWCLHANARHSQLALFDSKAYEEEHA